MPALAPRDGAQPVPFDEFEELLAALIAQDLADEGAEGVHVLAQRSVLRRELNVLAIHLRYMVGPLPRRPHFSGN